MIKVDIKLEEGGIMPSKEFQTAIGYDLFFPEDRIIEMGRQVVPLNFRIKLPKEYGAFIFNRSGTSAKGMAGLNIYNKLIQCRNNCDVNLGLVDPTYTGVVGLLIDNKGQAFQVNRGDSVAQMVIIKCESVDFDLTTDFNLNTERGEQGFKA